MNARSFLLSVLLGCIVTSCAFVPNQEGQKGNATGAGTASSVALWAHADPWRFDPREFLLIVRSLHDGKDVVSELESAQQEVAEVRGEERRRVSDAIILAIAALYRSDGQRPVFWRYEGAQEFEMAARSVMPHYPLLRSGGWYFYLPRLPLILRGMANPPGNEYLQSNESVFLVWAKGKQVDRHEFGTQGPVKAATEAVDLVAGWLREREAPMSLLSIVSGYVRLQALRCIDRDVLARAGVGMPQVGRVPTEEEWARLEVLIEDAFAWDARSLQYRPIHKK